MPFFSHMESCSVCSAPSKARWQDFFAEFDYKFPYKPGKANVVADALSRNRKAELATLTASTPDYIFLDRRKEGLQQDTLAKNLLKLASKGKTRRFWVNDGTLMTVGNLAPHRLFESYNFTGEITSQGRSI